MILKFTSPDVLFNLDNIIVISWLTLIFAPFKKLSKYFILSPPLFLATLYTIILFRTLFFREPDSPPLDFFHLSGWFALLKDPYMIIGSTSHFCIMDLWVGYWMVYDFYSGYTFAYSITMNSNGVYQVTKSWTFGRIIFTIILLLTYMVGPFGFLMYHLAKFTFLKKYETHVRINIKDDLDIIDKTNNNQFQTDLITRRYVRFGDQFPEPLRKIYHVIVGTIGSIVLFTIALPAYIMLRIYCRITYHSKLNKTSTNPNKFIPEYVRNAVASMKLTSLTTPYEKRNWIWHLKFMLLQISTFIEYIANADTPHFLFTALQNYFTEIYHVSCYTFGDGIGVGSHALVKRYLQDIPPNKGFESLGWNISSSQKTFCDFTTIFLSSDNPDMKLSRQIVFQWLHAFPYNLRTNNNEARTYLSRIVPRRIDRQPESDAITQAVGEVMFFLATGGELKKHEREAFHECATAPFIFFPDWFNFLLAGHYLERKTLNGYYTILQAFSRYVDGPALRAAFKAADNKKSNSEVLRLIAIVFSIAGSAAPSKLAGTVIERLWCEKDKEKNVRLFKKNPHNFIKECARLDKIVPNVNVFATQEIINDIEKDFQNNNQNIKIPENTPIHCSLVLANRDKNVFQNPDEFLPERSDLNKIIVWNGVEEDILNADITKRPVRYCPGHDFSIDVIQFVAEQFLPIVSDDGNVQEPDFLLDEIDGQNHVSEENLNMKALDENDKKLISMNLNINGLNGIDLSCYAVLDNYTKIVIYLMQKAVKESNLAPSRAIDIDDPLHLPAHDLGILRTDMAKFLPTWDEDDPKGSGLDRRIARWLVNQNIWDFYDSPVEFNSLEQAIKWRVQMFSDLPVPNVIYEDMFSDKALTQLAFAGCACHYTQRMEKEWTPGSGIPEQRFMKNAVYVNDMTGLSAFNVRKPFERYGAAAYFDEDFQIIAIYWSHANQLIKKGEQFWNHAKYVWRSSFFAYITIRDHLIVTHMIEGNVFVSASRQHLPTDHSLRRFIKPFTYHTISVNYQASVTLVNNRGLVHRIWAFDYDEFLKVCDYISMNYKFLLLPDFISDTMSPENNKKSADEWDKIYPIYHDINTFWMIIRKYVTNFFEINYKVNIKNDDLPTDLHMKDFIDEICKQLGIEGITSLQRFIDVLTKLIASSTGVHEHVGQISDYMLDPRFIGAKLQEGKEIQNIQTYTQILVLSVVTGLRMPGLLEDWSHLIERNQYYSKNLENYETFKQDLKDLSKDIDDRNKIRNYPFQSFNPKYMECSTSV
ncbi:unnamed protein product [Adineta steineri]|uniref:Lipoxygenase domain-containing protein n=2 Tax=Adineta steineri TaxID=433720 RepID=A0A815BKW1_9BILA|nr:unnamed protein product [Adineta steineri]CAF3789184.1 unnamed protein product [Adineta steineri]